MNTIKKYTVKKEVAGQKTGEKENLGTSYSIYERCSDLPMDKYIDLVCNNNMNALIISGEPPEDLLESTKIDLIMEFSDLSGNTQSMVINNLIRQIYLYRTQIRGFQLVLELLSDELFEDAVKYLQDVGIKASIPQNETELTRLGRLVNGKAKEVVNKLRESDKRYSNLTKEEKSVSRSYYNDQLVSMCVHFKFNLKISDLTAAQYASYLKFYSKDLRNGRQ